MRGFAFGGGYVGKGGEVGNVCSFRLWQFCFINRICITLYTVDRWAALFLILY